MNPYYQDDLVTLYHGDCREVTEWLAADVLVTDPPYGINAEATEGRFQPASQGGGRKRVRRASPIANDRTTDARDSILLAWGHRPAVVFGSWRMPRPDATQHRLIWHKGGSFSGPANCAFMSQDEEIYILGTGFRKSSPPMRSVIRTEEVRQIEVANIGHPTPKPLGLMEALIDRCPRGVIADPFAGSGSTLVAAKQLGRNAIGVELDERYCEIAARRLSQDTLFGAAS